MNLFESTFWGHEQMLTPAILNVSTSVLWLGIILFCTSKINFSVNQLFSIFIAIQVLTALCYFIVLYSKKAFKGTVQPFFSSSKALIGQSWPYFVLVVLNLPYTYLTNNFLDINSTKTEIGFFNLTQKMMSPISLVITFSLSALFPNLSKLWMDDQEKFKRIINQTTKLFFLMALVLCFLYTSFAEDIVKLFFNTKYYAIIKISQMQVWYVFLMGINSLIGTIWGATNNEKMLVKSSIINVIIAFPILYFSSKYGALGLSYGYVLSFAIFEIYLWIDFKKSINIKIDNDLLMWLAFAILFLLSYLFFHYLSFIIKIIIISVLISSVLIFYLKQYKNKVKVSSGAFGA
jgi:O-antigen/teichoic acid export membrane protein